jgi:hypothetical protein
MPGASLVAVTATTTTVVVATATAAVITTVITTIITTVIATVIVAVATTTAATTTTLAIATGAIVAETAALPTGAAAVAPVVAGTGTAATTTTTVIVAATATTATATVLSVPTGHVLSVLLAATVIVTDLVLDGVALTDAVAVLKNRENERRGTVSRGKAGEQRQGSRKQRAESSHPMRRSRGDTLIEEKWQNTSSPPLSGVMNPKPRSFQRAT